MNQLNSIIIEGNITHMPESRETPHGFKVCKIPLAVNRFYKNADGENINEVSYFDIETFGKMAEFCEKNSDKGRGVRVVGRLRQNRWKTTDGKNTSKISIIAEHVEFKPRLQKKEDRADLSAIADAEQAALEEETLLDGKSDESIKEESVF